MTILTKREVWTRPRVIGPSRYTPDLTAEEQANVRRALQVLRRRFGSWAAVAEALHVKVETAKKGGGTNSKPSVGLALRVTRVAGVPLEDILSGAWPKPGACPTCGRCDG